MDDHRAQAYRIRLTDRLVSFYNREMQSQKVNLTQERVQVLDVLRGFALLGIILINSMSILAVKGSTPAFTIDIPAQDRFLQDLILFFVESKFFTLFSLLFGIGFAIQIQSASRQRVAFFPRVFRRMLCLLVFGLMHIALLWDGDILVIYALTGSILILFRNVSYVAIRRWVIALLAIPAVLTFAALVYTFLARMTAAGSESFAAIDQTLVTEFANTDATEKLLQSSYLEGISERINSYIELLPLLLSRIPTVLAMFLSGIYLGRSNFIKDLAAQEPMLRKVRFWGLSLGFTLMALILMATKFLPPLSGLIAIIEDQYLAGPILCLGYAAAVNIDFSIHPERKLYGYFANVGRMALTNYLLQSLVLTFISYGWGLGLAMQLSGFEVVGICLTLFAAQVLFSRSWLKNYSYGPFEWLWRYATYWSRPKLSKE